MPKKKVSAKEQKRREIQQPDQAAEQPSVSLQGLVITLEAERNEARGQATFWHSKANDLEIENRSLKEELERRISEDVEESSEVAGDQDGKGRQAGGRGEGGKAGGSGTKRERRPASGKRS